MKLEPIGNWIHVSLDFDEAEEEHEKSLIALPDDYKPAEKPYKAVSVVCDFKDEYKHGDIVIVPTHVIREIELRDNRFYLIERNHIMATLK
jgi:co-chaperonin GroES (HSP10)